MSWLDQFEVVDIIGNGSFGIIRKVRRKADGMIFARKELNFERMSDRDRNNIVSEVNILKDLQHEHIVRYHDRYVDRDAGICYILMEYCGGGDLSTVLKQAQKSGRNIPEDTVWNYFMQILLALCHCHHPNGHSRTGSTGEGEGSHRRQQVLHRDLKPDNVFLDENHAVKLGDFGLSKALAQASFATTYVGTPYYMSPELMQEKAYDSKSDIWSLGCIIYELCAFKPPFHEAKTHAELSAFIRNGRIPPLPRGYSSSLNSTIKAMLSLNPAMRPSALQLLQHERIEYAAKVAETGRIVATVKTQKAAVAARERDVLAREHALAGQHGEIMALQQTLAETTQRLAHAHEEIARLQTQLHVLQAQHRADEETTAARVRAALAAREDELRAMVARHEEGVAAALAAREEELARAVQAREEALGQAWCAKEEGVRAAMTAREAELAEVMRRREEAVREEVLVEAREAVREREQEVERAWQEREDEIEEFWLAELERVVEEVKGATGRGPLEEIKNVLASPATTDDEASPPRPTPRAPEHGTKHAAFRTPVAGSRAPTSKKHYQTPLPSLTHNLLSSPHASPGSAAGNVSLPSPAPSISVSPSSPCLRASLACAPAPPAFTLSNAPPKETPPAPARVPGSAMKGVILTATGLPVSTPSPAEFVKLFVGAPLPRMRLDFGAGTGEHAVETDAEADAETSPVGERRLAEQLKASQRDPAPVDDDEGSAQTAAAARSKSAASRRARSRPSSPSKRDKAGPAAPLPLAASARALKRATSSARLAKKAGSGSSVSTGASVSKASPAPAPAAGSLAAAPPTRIRRPSIVRPAPRTRAAPAQAAAPKAEGNPKSASTSSASSSSAASTGTEPTTKQSSAAASGASSKRAAPPASASASAAAMPDPPQYDLEDEENLPSPFLKKVDKNRFPHGGAAPAAASAPAPVAVARKDRPAPAPVGTLGGRPKAATISAGMGKRLSGGNILRAVAAANSVHGARQDAREEGDGGLGARPSVASARRATEMAMQRLQA